VRLGKILLFLWLLALAQGAQAVAAPRENAFQYDECVSAASFEYWDQDAQLLYLRARWYDPRIGSFISADLFEGKQRDPRSLNRYAYAASNPVHNTDPGGEMTLGEVGSAMDTMFTLATRAYNVYDTLNSFLGGSDKLDGPPGLMDVLMATVIKASAGGVSTSDLGDAASAALLLATGGGTGPGHHTIPIYMCGGRNQERVTLTRPEHELLHAQLLGLSKLINVAGTVYQVLGKRRPPGALQPPLVQVARTPYGREAIAAGLGLFYQTEGIGGVTWANKGRGELTGRKLSLVFLKETWRFAVANHTWPTCKR
jgi:RHS repeat-associated protein